MNLKRKLNSFSMSSTWYPWLKLTMLLILIFFMYEILTILTSTDFVSGPPVTTDRRNAESKAKDGGSLILEALSSPSQPHLDAIRMYGVSHDLVQVDLDTLTEEQMILTLHSYLDNIDLVCERKLRMGNLDDGGWDICDDPDVRPVPPCLVYSFGIARDWSFDDAVAHNYGCHVFAFDPSTHHENHNRTARIHFYNVGIAGKSEVLQNRWHVFTLRDLRKTLGHMTHRIDVIKMDVESWEWASLMNMAESGQLETVGQLLVEFHLRDTSPLNDLKVLQAVEKAGFKKFYVHKNIHCPLRPKNFPVKATSCYEVHYMKL